MILRTTTSVALTVLALAASSLGASAGAAETGSLDAGTPAIAAVPGSRAGTYATPVAVVQPGDELTFINLELFPHDVRSVEMGPDNTSWCRPAEPDQPRHWIRNPRQFPIGRCPLLWSLPITMTLGAVETKVYGTENLESGKTVEFYCTVFPSMKGSLVVQ